MQYQQLSEAEAKQALSDRQAQLEREHLNNLLALSEAQARIDAGTPNDNDQDTVNTLTNNLSIIETAHAEVTAQLAGMPTDPSTDPGSATTIPTDVPASTKKGSH